MADINTEKMKGCRRELTKLTRWILNYSNLQAEDTADELRCKVHGDKEACENLKKRAKLIQSAEERIMKFRNELSDCLEELE